MAKIIAYTRPDGGVSTWRPWPFVRLVNAALIDGERREATEPMQLDDLIASVIGRSEPIETAALDQFQPEWAETEDEFLARLMPHVVPKSATDTTILDDADLPPRDERRAGWTLNGKAIAIDDAKVPAPPLDIKKRLQALESAVIGKTPVTKADIDAQVEVVATVSGDIIRG